jgi:ribonuclease VapC
MVVDSSALLAILFDEFETEKFVEMIDRDIAPKLSVVSQVETTMVYLGRRANADSNTVSNLVAALGLQLQGIDTAQAATAIEAFKRYGKGRHPARLNLGDCFSYALAAKLGEPLLFKGEDFARTDIAAAWRPSTQT